VGSNACSHTAPLTLYFSDTRGSAGRDEMGAGDARDVAGLAWLGSGGVPVMLGTSPGWLGAGENSPGNSLGSKHSHRRSPSETENVRERAPHAIDARLRQRKTLGKGRHTPSTRAFGNGKR